MPTPCIPAPSRTTHDPARVAARDRAPAVARDRAAAAHDRAPTIVRDRAAAAHDRATPVARDRAAAAHDRAPAVARDRAAAAHDRAPTIARQRPAAAGDPVPAPARAAAAQERAPAPAGDRVPRGAHVLDAAALSRHLDRLYRAAVALCGSPVDAEDLVQEVCVRALSKPRFVHGADDLPYLMRMLRNVFYNECRAQASRRTTPVEPETLTTVADPGRHDPVLGAVVGDVHRAIAALPGHYRDVVIAVDVLGLPYADAAEALGVPVGTVMSRLSRGRVGVARAVGELPAA